MKKAAPARLPDLKDPLQPDLYTPSLRHGRSAALVSLAVLTVAACACAAPAISAARTDPQIALRRLEGQ